MENLGRRVTEREQIDALNEAVARLRRESDGWRELADANGAEAMRRAEELRGAVGALEQIADPAYWAPSIRDKDAARAVRLIAERAIATQRGR